MIKSGLLLFATAIILLACLLSKTLSSNMSLASFAPVGYPLKYPKRMVTSV
jgi:hypothetical protein